MHRSLHIFLVFSSDFGKNPVPVAGSRVPASDLAGQSSLERNSREAPVGRHYSQSSFNFESKLFSYRKQ